MASENVSENPKSIYRSSIPSSTVNLSRDLSAQSKLKRMEEECMRNLGLIRKAQLEEGSHQRSSSRFRPPTHVRSNAMNFYPGSSPVFNFKNTEVVGEGNTVKSGSRAYPRHNSYDGRPAAGNLNTREEDLEFHTFSADYANLDTKASCENLKGYKLTKIIGDKVVQTVLLEFLSDRDVPDQRGDRADKLDSILVEPIRETLNYLPRPILGHSSTKHRSYKSLNTKLNFMTKAAGVGDSLNYSVNSSRTNERSGRHVEKLSIAEHVKRRNVPQKNVFADKQSLSAIK